jgi:hypothetical protein
MGKKETLYTIGGNENLVQPLRESVWRFLQKLKMELPYDLAIPLLGIYLKESQSTCNRDICILMLPWHY